MNRPTRLINQALAGTSLKRILAVPWVLFLLTLTLVAQGSQTSRDPDLSAAERDMERGNFAQAAEVLERLVSSKTRSHPEAYIMLATCRLNLKQKDQALDICERGIELHPNSKRLEEFQLWLLRASSTKAEIKRKLEQGLQQKPNSAVYMKGLGQLLMEENPIHPQVERLLAKAASLSNQDAEVHFLYGKWACLNHKESLCIAELSRALALSPDNEQARMQSYTLIAVAEDKLNRLARAEAAFRLAMQSNRKLASPSPHAALQYVEFLVTRSQDGEAQRVIDEILTWAPSFAPAHFERAKSLSKQRELEKAIEAAKLALEHAGNDKNQLLAVHAFLAKTYFALGRLEEAQVHQRWIESR